MPRRARIALPNVPVHLIQRGNNRQSCFFDYVYLVPYVEEPDHYFLKTVIPSRKATRDYLLRSNPDEKT